MAILLNLILKLIRLFKVSILKIVKVNNNKIVYNINISNKKLSKSKSIKKFLKTKSLK